MAKKVLVIGAGVSGLGAVKCCLDEGLSVVCLERTGDIGGLWNYQDEAVEGKSTVMRSTTINTSKEMTQYSDFPMPDDFPNYCHHSKFMEYVRLYVDHFQLRKHIRFETEVLKLKPSGRAPREAWEATTKDLRTGDVRSELFDAVMVCSGHHADKKMAHFEGEREFEGQIVHSHDYRDHRGYEQKRVVVVGIGNSGGDIAVELGKISKQTYLSTRRGAWVLHRVWENGLPLDMIFSRWSDIMAKVLPREWMNSMMEKKMNEKFDHELYGMKPKHRYDQQHPTANDDLPNRIIAGAVIVKPDIKRLTRTGVEFVDGSVAENIDTIISATGYIFGFPFIELKDLEVKNNQVNLYKLVFPPDVQPKGSLAVIGCFQPVGGFIPISELQARWAIRVFKGELELPSSAEMRSDIERRRATLARRYVDSTRHTIQVDYVDYQVELSEQCGCKPNLLKLLVCDPVLAYHVLFGPYTPYQNRLVGPGAWSGARRAVLTTMQRVKRGYNQGYNVKKRNDSAGRPWPIVFFAFLILALIWKYLM